MAEPVDKYINAHILFLRTLSYLTIKKQVAAAAQMCSEERASRTFSWTVAKVAPVVQSSPGLRYSTMSMWQVLAWKLGDSPR